MRARSWKVSLRSAGPPTSRACRAMAPKSSPCDPVSATGSPVTAETASGPPLASTQVPSAKFISLNGFIGRPLAAGEHGLALLHEGGDALLVVGRAAELAHQVAFVVELLVERLAPGAPDRPLGGGQPASRTGREPLHQRVRLRQDRKSTRLNSS